MKKKVMDIGQCKPDHQAIKNFLETHFDCEVVKVDSLKEALEELQKTQYNLVLVNRKLDLDYSDGTLVIRKIKESTQFSSIPIMLISNYPEYQQEAVQLGALYGFGKAELSKPETIEKVKKALFSI